MTVIVFSLLLVVTSTVTQAAPKADVLETKTILPPAHAYADWPTVLLDSAIDDRDSAVVETATGAALRKPSPTQR